VRYVASAVGGAVLALLVTAAVLFALDLELVEGDEPPEPVIPTVSVPDVVGQGSESARAQIEALGLEVREQGIRGAFQQVIRPPLVVDSQVPPAGTEAPVDATVTLRVAPE
jgi:hypothetical protein